MTDIAQKPKPFGRLTPLMALQLAAPHTWPAAILPCLLAVACAMSNSAAVSFSLSVTLLVICVLMQAAVNTFNDYFDYVKGTDSAEDNVEVSDAVLIYNNVNPRHALYLAIGFLAVAFLLGIYPIMVAGATPLVIAAIAAVIVVLYSGGKTPISYLPIGEAVSGIVMGGLIPLACYQVLTGHLEPMMLLWAVPCIINVGLIMMTNNTCDIEKDILAGRKTLPVLLGRKRAVSLYHALMVTSLLIIVAVVAVFYFKGVVVLPFMALGLWGNFKALWGNPLVNPSRIGAMAQVGGFNVIVGAFYAAAILASSWAILVP